MEEFYLDNTAMTKAIKAFKTNGKNLIFDKAPFQMEHTVVGTESMSKLVADSKLMVKLTEDYRSFVCDGLVPAMLNIQKGFNEDAESVAEILSNNGMDNQSDLYDDDGQYGEDQGGPAGLSKEYILWFFHVKSYKDLCAFIRQHKGYENLTDEEIEELLNILNETGCSYAAACNAIFAMFENNPQGFEQAFGFPMYDDDGDFNYNYLLVDYFLETRNKYYIGENDKSGEAALEKAICAYYSDDDGKTFKKEYGIELYEDPNAEPRYYSSEAMKIIRSEAKKLCKGNEVVTYDKDANTCLCIENRLNHYLNSHNVSGFEIEDTVQCSRSEAEMTPEEIESELEAGSTVIIAASNFNLFHEDGTPYDDERVGGHYMTVTGVTDDGYLIVSTWGKRLLYKPDGGKYSDCPNEYVIVRNEMEAIQGDFDLVTVTVA